MSKISLAEPNVPIRETRLGSITAFDGCAGELVKESHGCKLKECKRKFSQCWDVMQGRLFASFQ